MCSFLLDVLQGKTKIDIVTVVADFFREEDNEEVNVFELFVFGSSSY
jgi:hypothetical protein